MNGNIFLLNQAGENSVTTDFIGINFPMGQRMSNQEMEELQLSIEERLYALSLVKLGEDLEFLKLEITDGESRAQALRKIRKAVDEKVDAGGENVQEFLLGLQAVIIGSRQEEIEEDYSQYGDTEGENPIAEIEDLKLKFQKILDTQLREVEQRYQQQTGGKKVAAHESDATISSKNMIRIKDGVISNEKNRLPYSSLNKQIDSALKRGYPENDIIDGVISVIAPSLHLRAYLESMKTITLPQLQQILRSHYCEKSATEAYQELAGVVQEHNETPFNFLMRALKLRQHILASSKEAGSKIRYDEGLVQSVFLNSLETGLIDASIRSLLRPLLQSKQVTDEQLIREMNLAMSSENERANKINSRKSTRKPALVNSIATNATPSLAKESKHEKEDKVLATLNAIKADVDNLKAAFAKQEQNSTKQNKGRGNLVNNVPLKAQEISVTTVSSVAQGNISLVGVDKEIRETGCSSTRGEKCSCEKFPKHLLQFLLKSY